MSTISNDMRPLAAPPDRPGAQPARPPLPGASRALDVHGGEPGTNHAAGTRGGPPAAESITGKVYALKDGSGYVALATDGHYYKLDPGGGGLTYASASGPVDKSMVDVTHGPVRAMRRTAGAHRLPVPSHDGPAPAAHDAAVRGAGHAPGSPTAVLDDTRDPPAPPGVARHARAGAAPDLVNGARADSDLPSVPAPAGAAAAAAAARATHGLIVRHPGAALRSHGAVSTDAVASLLR